MNLFFSGSLYFYITINLVASSGSYISYEGSGEIRDFENCTEWSVKSGLCFCMEYNAEKTCLTCCANIPQCCCCENCTICWYAEWQSKTITHISISILFALGVTGLIIMYCKICNRRLVRAECIATQQEHNAIYCNTVEGLRERPPPYSEVCSAPPLYTSPYNRASMQEAPPMYPGTPKPQERSRNITNTNVSSVIQHM